IIGNWRPTSGSTDPPTTPGGTPPCAARGQSPTRATSPASPGPAHDAGSLPVVRVVRGTRGGAPVRVAKLHGLGNSYIYIDLITQPGSGVDWTQFARRVSDPAFGIGSDGLILLLPSTKADVCMRMFNVD